jgi:hypothetical protein
MQTSSLATSVSELAEAISVKFRRELTKAMTNVTEKGLSRETFAHFLEEVKSSVKAAGLASVEHTLASLDEGVARIRPGGVVMRDRGSERKDWLTVFGVARPLRRYYTPDGG